MAEDKSFSFDSLYERALNDSKKTVKLNPFMGMGLKLKIIIGILAYLIISGIIANIVFIINL